MIEEQRDNQVADLVSRGNPALIVVDVQRDFADPERISVYEPSPAALVEVANAVDSVARLVDSARSLGVPIVWVELGSDPERPWRSSNWLRGGGYGSPMSPSEPCILGSEGAEWYGVSPAQGELRIIKPRYSGFLGTSLEDDLHAAGYGWLTVVGLTSECCVRATALDAMQREWPVVVARDCTAAYDGEIHSAALTELELNIAVVADSADCVSWWKESVA